MLPGQQGAVLWGNSVTGRPRSPLQRGAASAHALQVPHLLCGDENYSSQDAQRQAARKCRASRWLSVAVPCPALRMAQLREGAA